MQQVNTLLDKLPTTGAPLSQPQPTTTSKPLTSEQRDSVAYFFMRLANVYGSKYLQQWPNAEAVNMAKREWAEQIGQFSRNDIDLMFVGVKKMLIAGDDEWQWPEIGRILGSVLSWEHRRIAAADREQPLALENKTAREEQRNRNRERMAKMRAEIGI